MHEIQIRNKYFRIAITLVILCFAAHPCWVLAEELTGSLTICYAVSTEGKAMPIEGAEFSLYKVADIDGNLKVTSLYSDHDFLNMDADEMEKLSSELANKLKVADISGVTDKKGMVTFPDLDTGIYLVKQSGRYGNSVDYDVARPFLIGVPSEDGYDVICYPKTSPRKSAVPKTGDNMKIWEKVLSLAAAGSLLAGVLYLFKKKGEDDRC